MVFLPFSHLCADENKPVIGVPLLPGEPAVPYTIEELTMMAVQSNRDLKQLEIEREKTNVDLRAAKAGRFPTVNGEIRLNHIANPIDPVSVTAGEFGSYPIAGQDDVLIPPQDVRIYEGMESMMYQFILSMEQPVFTWGKIRNSIDLYKNVLSTRRLNIEKKQQELGTMLRIYVYSLYFISEMEELIAEQREIAERLVYISEKAYENGFIVYSELLEAQIQAQKINLAENQLLQQREQIFLDIKHATLIDNVTYETISFKGIDTDIKGYILPPKEKLLTRALQTNKDLKLLLALKLLKTGHRYTVGTFLRRSPFPLH